MLVAINTFAILCVAFVFFLTFSRKTPLIIQNIKYKSTNTKYATPLQCSTLLLPPRPFHATTGEEYTFHPVLFLYSTKWFLFLREPGIYHSIEIHSRSANPIIVFIVIDEESDRFMKVSKDTSTGIATAAAVAAVPSCIIHRATPLHQQQTTTWCAHLLISCICYCIRVFSPPLHNVLFIQYVFFPTEQAETYLKIYVLIYHSTYFCPSLFGWNETLIFKETVTFKLLILDFILTEILCSKNNVSSKF